MTSPFVLVDDPVPPAGSAAVAELADDAWTFHHSLRQYRSTPLRQLAPLASTLGISAIHLKDESTRLGLNAFKALGASFAMQRWLATHDVGAESVFTTATDGNHGRAVAWMARQLGMRAVVFMPSHSVPARVAAIENEGARVVLVEQGYDAAVQRALRAGETDGWIVIQDTATPTYTEVPGWIEAGYWTMARELEPALHPAGRPEVDLVVLHAGVGTWPAAMVRYYWHRYGTRRPRIVIVEPAEAACVLESVRAGHPTLATGSQRTIMAGLNCGFPSTAAFDTLCRGVDAFIAIEDRWAERAMRVLAGGSPPIVAGESGAASVAGLLAIIEDPALDAVRRHIALGPTTRVLVWSTEGATDPAAWEAIVGWPPPESTMP